MKVTGLVLHGSAKGLLDAFVASPAHALLLGGPQGSGKTLVARSLAARLLGVDEAALTNHGYFRVVAPGMPVVGKTKATSKAAMTGISIEQVRELIGFFRLKVPGAGAIRRVAIIEDADAMGTEAQNALLKALEEPPADSVLILTSSRPERLLATIRSRTQVLQLPSPDKQQLIDHFAAAGHTEAAIAAALLRSGTNIAEAERLLTTGASTPDTAVTLVKQVLGGTTYDRLLLVDGLAKQKEDLNNFVDTLATVAMASLNATAAKGGNVQRWQDVLQAAHTAQDALERSGNAKLVLTELMLTL